MKFLTTVILILIGLVVIAGISFFGYQFYKKLNAPAESPFKAIPQNSAMIIKLNKPSALWSQTVQNNELWQDLFSVGYLASLKTKISFLDSLLIKDQKLGISIRINPLYIILSPTVSNFYGMLLMINVSTSTKEDEIVRFIEKSLSSEVTIKKNSYAGSSIYQVTDKKKKDPFFFTIRSGIFMGSREQLLIKQAIDKLSLNLTYPDDQGFLKVTATSGKNVDANIFINFERMAPFMPGIIKSGALSDYLSVSNFADWTGLDLIQKKDKWLISGYTVCNDSSYKYLSLFQDQSPQNISMMGLLPGNTVSFAWIGLSNPDAYYQKLSASKMNTTIYKTFYPHFLHIENTSKIRLQDYFLPWTGNEIGLVKSTHSENDIDQHFYGIIKTTDRKLTDSLLQDLGIMITNKIRKETYKGHSVYDLNIPYLIPEIWGNLFRKLTGSAYTLLGDYVIFGNDPASVQEFLDQVLSEDILMKSPEFRTFSENLSDQANIFYYYDPLKVSGEFQSMLADELKKEIDPAFDSLKTFESIGIQLINNADNFITNVYVNHKKGEYNKGPLAWQTALDTLIARKPVIMMDVISGKPGIVTFDLANTMYLIDLNGTVKWKLKVPGQPLGDVFIIRPGNTDSTCFLFNTLKHICIVDKNGLFAFDSPFFLPLQAVTGLTCCEFSLPGSYQIIIPLEDKKIYSFDIFGKQMPGWSKPSMDDFIVKPVQHLKWQGKDLLFSTSRIGHVHVTDRKGKPVITIRDKVLFSDRSDFYLNKTNNKGSFLTSSKDGKLIYLRNDGKTAELKFNNFTHEHVFHYADINNDKIQEFIYFDLNKIYCYNRFQKILFEYSFPSLVLPPFIIKTSSGEIMLGAVSPKTGDVYLFGKKGLMTIDPAIRGNTLFDIRVLNPELGTSLIIGAGKYLKNYILSE